MFRRILKSRFKTECLNPIRRYAQELDKQMDNENFLLKMINSDTTAKGTTFATFLLSLGVLWIVSHFKKDVAIYRNEIAVFNKNLNEAIRSAECKIIDNTIASQNQNLNALKNTDKEIQRTLSEFDDQLLKKLKETERNMDEKLEKYDANITAKLECLEFKVAAYEVAMRESQSDNARDE